MLLAIAGLVIISVVVGSVRRAAEKARDKEWKKNHIFHWQHYDALDGYYNGVRTQVPFTKYEPQNRYNQSKPPNGPPDDSVLRQAPLNPIAFDPYPDYKSVKYLQDHDPVHDCYLDAGNIIPARNVYAYPGLTQHFPQPFYGSRKELGVTNDMCFDRFGRLAPYGLGFNRTIYGDRKKLYSQHMGSEQIFSEIDPVNYTDIDWSIAQAHCRERNQARFTGENGNYKVPRHAYILRTWTGYNFDEHQIFTMRAMINELALKSGAEYDVHLLVHVKNESIPIWADKGVYNYTLQNAVPKEFWNIATLWSVPQMKMYYTADFDENFANLVASNVHGAYRSPHFPLQWFSQQHPEYDFYWNWEMDLRYSGHYYELNSKIGEWAKRQPRKGLWERNQRFWLPEHHGDFQNFTQFIEDETISRDLPNHNTEKSGPLPVWGPVQDFENADMLPPPNDTTPPTTYDQDNYHWGVGEEADLLVFNPIFDPFKTNWVFRRDVTGYSTALPIPPRRAAIITAARFSKRLLNIMHEEVWHMGHTMFPEMFAPTMCLHHGLKAVYVPHPVYFDHDWELGHMDQVLNYPRAEHESPFGWGENNMLGSTFYYNSGFGAKIWRRWLGQWEDEEEQQRWEGRTGRMCLPPMLFHPVKYETETEPR